MNLTDIPKDLWVTLTGRYNDQISAGVKQSSDAVQQSTQKMGQSVAAVGAGGPGPGLTGYLGAFRGLALGAQMAGSAMPGFSGVISQSTMALAGITTGLAGAKEGFSQIAQAAKNSTFGLTGFAVGAGAVTAALVLMTYWERQASEELADAERDFARNPFKERAQSAIDAFHWNKELSRMYEELAGKAKRTAEEERTLMKIREQMNANPDFKWPTSGRVDYTKYAEVAAADQMRLQKMKTELDRDMLYTQAQINKYRSQGNEAALLDQQDKMNKLRDASKIVQREIGEFSKKTKASLKEVELSAHESWQAISLLFTMSPAPGMYGIGALLGMPAGAEPLSLDNVAAPDLREWIDTVYWMGEHPAGIIDISTLAEAQGFLTNMGADVRDLSGLSALFPDETLLQLLDNNFGKFNANYDRYTQELVDRTKWLGFSLRTWGGIANTAILGMINDTVAQGFAAATVKFIGFMLQFAGQQMVIHGGNLISQGIYEVMIGSNPLAPNPAAIIHGNMCIATGSTMASIGGAMGIAGGVMQAVGGMMGGGGFGGGGYGGEESAGPTYGPREYTQEDLNRIRGRSGGGSSTETEGASGSGATIINQKIEVHTTDSKDLQRWSKGEGKRIFRSFAAESASNGAAAKRIGRLLTRED